MENIKITHIVVNANAGSEIEKCMAEAIKLAVTEWRNVHLFHNEKEYIVNVNDLLQAVFNKNK